MLLPTFRHYAKCPEETTVGDGMLDPAMRGTCAVGS
jgi:hypothetical protein